MATWTWKLGLATMLIQNTGDNKINPKQGYAELHVSIINKLLGICQSKEAQCYYAGHIYKHRLIENDRIGQKKKKKTGKLVNLTNPSQSTIKSRAC